MMAKAYETGGPTPDLTPEEINAQVQAESLKAARTGLNNALTNAGFTVSTDTSGAKPFTQPMTIAGATPAPSAPASDALKNKSVKPEAPNGYVYIWIGSTGSGSWKLYKDPNYKAKGSSTTPKVIARTVKNPDGTSTVYYTDGTSQVLNPVSMGGSGGSATSDVIAAQNAAAIEEQKMLERQSAYDLLYNQFKQYGLESLVEGIKDLIKQNVSPSEFSIRLQDTDAYKKRFAANQDRIKAGLKALTPAEYIGLEDQYQNIMRNYGLPASYYTKDAMGTQAGFNKFIANDVSAAELEDRISTAVQRVNNADVNVKDALRRFYPNITDGDILAYTLDPTNALNDIKRKVTAAEIGGAALGQNLMTNVGRAEELAQYGVTKAKAQEGYGTIGEFLPTAEKLGNIYANQGLGAYDQATAETEVFGTAGSAEAAKKRKRLSELEQRQFQGQVGTSQGALDRGRSGAY